jgi:acetyltransferase-like isoleucine patch superfamily enzyme
MPGQRIAATAKIHPNVRLGEDVEIGDFVVIGEPPRGAAPGALETVIGDGAVVRSHTVIYAGNVIGPRFQCGHGALIREQNTIGAGVSIGSHSIIEHHVKIGDRARCHSGVFVPEYSELEEESWLGPRVTITNAKYPASAGAKESLRGARVGRRAKVGAQATLLPGVVLGADCLVGAGAVVTKDVPARAVVIGNPACVIRTIDELPY